MAVEVFPNPDASSTTREGIQGIAPGVGEDGRNGLKTQDECLAAALRGELDAYSVDGGLIFVPTGTVVSEAVSPVVQVRRLDASEIMMAARPPSIEAVAPLIDLPATLALLKEHGLVEVPASKATISPVVDHRPNPLLDDLKKAER
jgi:hypothetical protein